MNVLHEARTILTNADYRVSGSPDSTDTFYFEDDSIVGSVTEHRSVRDLLDGWEKSQDDFLLRHVGQLKEHPQKAWNIYTVHLTVGRAAVELASRLFDIEEDFRGTRKLARAGIQTKDDCRLALLPLIPIQNHPTLTGEGLTARLKDRLLACHSSLGKVLDKLPPKEVAHGLVEAEEE